MHKVLEDLVYPDMPFGDKIGIPEDLRKKLQNDLNLDIPKKIPGIKFENILFNDTSEESQYQYSKLIQSCRKLCMMWHAGEEARKAERKFYSSTIQDAPALFGEHAIKVNYHLEALVLIARSSMDVASGIFGQRLPDPFKIKRYDSFNRLLKDLLKTGEPHELCRYFEELRDDPKSWVSIISGAEKGRSLRDKVAHQTEFPLDITK
jgi:hypothetical protein